MKVRIRLVIAAAALAHSPFASSTPRVIDTYAGDQDATIYGYDPIHMLLRSWKEAWAEILIPWNPEFDKLQLHCVTPSFRRKFAMVMARAEHWGRFSMDFSRLQPSVRLACGTLMSLY